MTEPIPSPDAEAQPTPSLKVPKATSKELNKHVRDLNIAWMLVGIHDSSTTDTYRNHLERARQGAASEEVTRIYQGVQALERTLKLSSDEKVQWGDQRAERERIWFERQGIDIEKGFDAKEHLYRLPSPTK